MPEALLTLRRTDLEVLSACPEALRLFDDWVMESSDLTEEGVLHLVWSPLAQLWAATGRHIDYMRWLHVRGLLPYWSLRDCDLSGVDLSHGCFENFDMEYVTLNDACLRETKVWSSNLSHSHLLRVIWAGASLLDSDLRDTVLCNAELDRGRWNNLLLQRADLSGATASHLSVAQSQLSHANLTKVQATSSVWRYCKINSVAAMATDFEESQFVNCDLSLTSFEGANLSRTSWLDCNLTGCDLRRANLTDAVFRKGCDLTGVHWPYATPPEGWKVGPAGVLCRDVSE